MSNEKTFNVYCDESCHLEHDHQSVMVLGALVCSVSDTNKISEAIRDIKRRHKLSPAFEIKWTKVSRGKLAFYSELISFFLNDDRLRFRAVLVPDKLKLDHAKFSQTHDDWYYKMYFTMLKYIIHPPHHYRIYIDIKDTRSARKAEKLHNVLANSIYDFNRHHIERVQQIRSHESEILQLTDLLIGAISYTNRGLVGSSAKQALVEQLQSYRNSQLLSQTSSFGSTKFNLLVWAES